MKTGRYGEMKNKERKNQIKEEEKKKVGRKKEENDVQNILHSLEEE